MSMPGVMEYDAQNAKTLILSHLDGDIARLVRVRQALEHSGTPYEILCYHQQQSHTNSRYQCRTDIFKHIVKIFQN